jgi:hypothetical protein
MDHGFDGSSSSIGGPFAAPNSRHRTHPFGSEIPVRGGVEHVWKRVYLTVVPNEIGR